MKNKFDVSTVREDFPILASRVHGKPLVYLDNAATTQKPLQVIETEKRYYLELNANIHRGVHFLSQQATDAYENVRRKIQTFINADSENEIIFTSGTTSAINLVAASFSEKFLQENDEVLISGMEHHSNIVPWQMACEKRGAALKVIPLTDQGELDLDVFKSLLSDRVKIVSLVHIGNSLGTINPVREIIALAHNKGIPVLIDCAQSIQHLPINVKELDCDFLVFSGHKFYGPTGVGVLYGKSALLNSLPPYQGGGDMILSVTFEKTVYNTLPHKFEAGTPNIAGVIGLGAAIDYVVALGLESIQAYEESLTQYTLQALGEVKGLQLIGTASSRSSVFSFVLEHIHPHDIGTILDYEGIAIRTGHHCTQPVMKRFGIPATARLSLGLYNTREEIDYFVLALQKVFEVFK